MVAGSVPGIPVLSARKVRGIAMVMSSALSGRRAVLLGGMVWLAMTGDARALSPSAADAIDPMDFGARGDGITDDHAAFTAADRAAVAAGAVLRITRPHLIGASLALAATLQWAGGRLKPAADTLLTVSDLMAPAVQVFDLSARGRVLFDGARMPLQAHAEWFGVRAEDPAAAATNQTWLNAALRAHPAIRLMTADYFVAGRIDISLANHTLEGSGDLYDGATAHQVTRLLCTSATSDIVLMGLPTWPGSVNALPEGISLRNLYLNRTVAPDIASHCDGLRMQFCRSAEVDHVKSVDSINTLHILGVVSSKIRECRFARVRSGTGGGQDRYNAIWIDGSPAIGLAGGVASIYLSDCSSECNNPALQAEGSTAHFLDSGAHGFQDVFIDRCESVSFAIATRLEGSKGGQADVRLRSITDDQARQACLSCSGLNTTSVITLQDYYGGPGAGAQAAVRVQDCRGSIGFIGGQILLSGLKGVTGVAIAGSRGVSLRGTVIAESREVAVAVAASSNCVIEPEIVNNRHSGGEAALVLSGPVTASRLAPVVHGRADAFGGGIRVPDRRDERNIYDLGGIDSACLKGGAATKLVRGGVPVTVAGMSGTNDVRGPMI